MTVTPAQPDAKPGPSGCAIGCFVTSLVLFLTSIGVAVWVFQRFSE